MRWLVLTLVLSGCDVSWHHIEWAQRVCETFGGLRYVNEYQNRAECSDGTLVVRPSKYREEHK
jgi:hypothetical protein